MTAKIAPMRAGPPRADTEATCTECRIHAARIGDVAAARYRPPLGPLVRIRARSGGTVAVCPRCTRLPIPHSISPLPGGPDGKLEPRSLVEAGLTTRRQTRRLRLAL